MAAVLAEGLKYAVCPYKRTELCRLSHDCTCQWIELRQCDGTKLKQRAFSMTQSPVRDVLKMFLD